MTNIPETDTQFRDAFITRVLSGSEGHDIRLSDGWSFFCPSGPFAPQVGQAVRLYGKEWGTIRGIVVGGAVFKYQTEEELQETLRAEAEERERQARAEYDAELPDLRRRIDALPEPYRKRVDDFLLRAPGTAWKQQKYELVTCEAALEIARACPSAKAVRAYAKLDHEQQLALTPALEAMGLSGNMHGVAMRLAVFSFTTPAFIWQSHAAICPLIGCREAGCCAADPVSTLEGK